MHRSPGKWTCGMQQSWVKGASLTHAMWPDSVYQPLDLSRHCRLRVSGGPAAPPSWNPPAHIHAHLETRKGRWLPPLMEITASRVALACTQEWEQKTKERNMTPF